MSIAYGAYGTVGKYSGYALKESLYTHENKFEAFMAAAAINESIVLKATQGGHAGLISCYGVTLGDIRAEFLLQRAHTD